ncbi:MAG: type II secretion system F family protein [Anaerolineae bacterium]
MTNGPLIFALLIGGLMIVGMVVLWRVTASRDLADARLRTLGQTVQLDDYDDQGAVSKKKNLTALTRMVNGFSFGPRLAASLSAADLSLTVSEYTLIILVAAVGGFALGSWRGGMLLGIVFDLVLGYIPIFYLGYRAKQRKAAFANQLPEILTLLVGSLRAGHGLSQALVNLTEQMPPPASVEFGRVTRAINLGLPVSRALNDMAERIGTSEIDLVVTAIVVQNELGGNLAVTLETISDTIRDRIRMKREIRVLTSQQRMTGGILALMPVALALGLSLISPGYMRPFFAPGLVRILPITAVVMQVIGFLVIRKIMDIEV